MSPSWAVSRSRWARLSSFLERQEDGTLRFLHALYREVAYEGLSYRRRQTLHAAVGGVLETPLRRRLGRGIRTPLGPLPRGPRLGPQLALLGDGRRQSPWEVRQPRGRGVLPAGPQRTPRRTWPEPPAIATVAESLGDVLELSARFDEAHDALQLARRHSSDSTAQVRLLRKEGHDPGAAGTLQPGVALVFPRPAQRPSEELADRAAARAEGNLSLAYAGVRFRQGRTEDCIQWAHRAERIAEQIDDHAMLAHACYLLMIGYGVLRRPEVADYRDRPLPLYEELGDLVGQANVLNNLGVDAKEEGRWAEAL